MMETLSSNFDLIANIVISGLCLALGFFISTVMAEKRHFKRQEGLMKAELQGAKSFGRSKEDLAEIERLRSELGRQAAELKQKTEALHERENELAKLSSVAQRSSGDVAELDRLHAQVAADLEAMMQKDHEIEKLIDQLNQVNEDHRKLEAQMSESFSERGELGHLRTEMNAKIEAAAAQEKELAKLQAERQAGAVRVGQAEKIVADYEKFEKTITDQRRSAHDVEQRIREMRIKLRVLSEKAKENVELIAAFAGGKEFDEFRKSIHLDELTRKYEDQIREGEGKK